jgi:DNA-binding transcriptional MocR family regulator
MLTRTSSHSLTDQLAARMAERLRNGLLPPGARLPSVRECARQFEVSPYTVVAAYDQLLAQGLIEARKQRGFFVRELRAAAPAAAGRADPAPIRPVDASALIRGMMQPPGGRIMPGTGVLPPEWLETPFLGAAVRRVTTGPLLNSISLRYGDAAGDADLRRALATLLAGYAITATPEQIVTTIGATHALDIVSRTLLRPGDAVLVEEPGWSVEFARLTALGMRLLPVPRGADGPDLAVMERYCQAHAPKLFVSVSVQHNPTGASLKPAYAHRVLQLAQAYDFHVMEDDTYTHFAPAHATRLCALDGLERTIYVSGFAKVLVPNWRIGYLAAAPELVRRFTETKLLSTLTTPALLERALSYCLEQGQIRRHAERLRLRLDAARSRSVKLALAAGCQFMSEPSGLFGWIDTGVDTDLLAQRMLDDGWLLAPGSLFHAERRPSTLMRINFATTQDAGFWKAFGRARTAL